MPGSVARPHGRRVRRLNGRDCKTATVCDKSRVFVGAHARRMDMARDPNKKHQHQASRNGGVLHFVPLPDKKCCKRQCLSHFPEADNSTVQRAREPLYERNLDKKTLRERYMFSLYFILQLFSYYLYCMTVFVTTGR